MNVSGADPEVLFDQKSGFYYAYATNSDDRHPFAVYRSRDLITWKACGTALDRSRNDWGKDWFWAPECYYDSFNQHYYLFYGARVKEELVGKYFGDPDYLECSKIGVAVSSSPEGPFVNIEDHPIDYYPYDPDYADVNQVYPDVFAPDLDLRKRDLAPKGVYLPSIDPNLFIDDGHFYLFFSRCCYKNCLYDPHYRKFIEESDILAVELDPAFWYDPEAKTMPSIRKENLGYDAKKTRREDSFHLILSYASDPQEWENGHIADHEKSCGGKPNRRWAEGSTTFVMDSASGKKRYALTYSCNCYQSPLYGVGIAFSDSPLGPYRKYPGNPIIHQDEKHSLYSTGHGSVIRRNGDLYYVFHGRDSLDSERILYSGRFVFEEPKGAVSFTDIHKGILAE
jgi:hypothetical protein